MAAITFQQYLGFLLFMGIITIGFWIMIFLIGFVHYWAGAALWQRFKAYKARVKE